MLCPFRKYEFNIRHNCLEKLCALWIENKGCAIKITGLAMLQKMQEVVRE